MIYFLGGGKMELNNCIIFTACAAWLCLWERFEL
nr:MAG TPA: hypothetical protein [Caudoviricetes sp.]